MLQVIKAMTAEDRILAAVSDIKNIKDRKGTASDDAVRVIMKKWWIPSNSKIANTLKWYSHNTLSDSGKSVIDIANTLVEHSAIDNDCKRYDVIHEVPSNGFKLPEGAGKILGKEVWIPFPKRNLNRINIVTAKVNQVGLHVSHKYYEISVAYIQCAPTDATKTLPEHAVFLSKYDCIEALKNKFINLDTI